VRGWLWHSGRAALAAVARAGGGGGLRRAGRSHCCTAHARPAAHASPPTPSRLRLGASQLLTPRLSAYFPCAPPRRPSPLAPPPSQVQPELWRGLSQLLSFDGDVEATFCANFTVASTAYGEPATVELIPGGADVRLLLAAAGLGWRALPSLCREGGGQACARPLAAASVAPNRVLPRLVRSP
jgi:hypothetical protein